MLPTVPRLRSRRTGEAAIYYAIGSDRSSRFNVRRSIETLRRFNGDVKVYVFIFGRCSNEDRRFFRDHRIFLRTRRHLTSAKLSLGKWLVLGSIKEERVLYVDCRLAFRDDPKSLFDNLTSRDIYAEPLQIPERPESEPWVDRRMFHKMLQILELPVRPFFQPRTILFNHHSQRKLARELGTVRELHRGLCAGDLPTPTADPFMLDVVLGSMSLSVSAGLRLGNPGSRFAQVLEVGRCSAGFSKAFPKERLCIVTTLRDAGASVVESFLRYHLGIGFERIFLFFDNPEDRDLEIARHFPGTSVLRNDAQLRALQEGYRIFPELRDFVETEVMHRQRLNVQTAIHAAQAEGIRWILHIDIDELFYSPHQPVDQHFAQLRERGVESAVYVNHEAIPEQLEIGDYFREVTLFKKNPLTLPSALRQSADYSNRRRFLAYSNGKAAAQIIPGLESGGVHRFHAPGKPLNTICIADPCVLHYVNCGLRQYQEKYRLLGHFSDNYVDDGNPRLEFHLQSRDGFLNGRARELYLDQILLTDRRVARAGLRSGALLRVTDVARTLAAAPTTAEKGR